jgi:hypothetical protein
MGRPASGASSALLGSPENSHSRNQRRFRRRPEWSVAYFDGMTANDDVVTTAGADDRFTGRCGGPRLFISSYAGLTSS